MDDVRVGYRLRSRRVLWDGGARLHACESSVNAIHRQDGTFRAPSSLAKLRNTRHAEVAHRARESCRGSGMCTSERGVVHVISFERTIDVRKDLSGKARHGGPPHPEFACPLDCSDVHLTSAPSSQPCSEEGDGRPPSSDVLLINERLDSVVAVVL